MRILIFILLSSCSFMAIAQPRGGGGYPLVPPSRANSGYYNMEKYWWYRYRLVNDFMKIGPDCGESMPAQRRNKPNDFRSTGYLKWADATIDLGNYIAMLATEHRILQNAGLNTQRSDMELKYALDAFERLDRNAEAYCADIDGTYPCNTGAAPQQWQNQLNGFFIRDDVPYLNIVPNNREHFNRPGIKNLISVEDWSCGAFMGRYWETGTPGGLREEFGPPSFTWRPLWLPGWMKFPPRVPSEESQDQVVQLGMGLALAVKTPGLFYAGKDLGKQASDNLKRIITHVASSSGYFGRKWSIMNPVRGSCVYGTKPKNDCNAGGAQMYPFAAALCNVLGQYCGVSLHSTVVETNTWQTMRRFPNVPDCNFAGTWSALTNSWRKNFDQLEKFAMAHDEGNPHLPYLNRVLFPKSGEWFRVEQTKQLLDAAPDCGIHNYNGTWSVQRNWQTGIVEHNPPKSHHWSGNDLIHEYYHRWSTTDNGDCNGLDFMVLFNLFAIQLGDYFPQGVFNSFYREDFRDRCPFRFGGRPFVGDASTKLTLNFLQYLSARNKVDPDGYLNFRCGKVIDLLPGFETLPGANFQAYVQDYEIKCNSGGPRMPGKDPGGEDDAYHYVEVNGKKLPTPGPGPRQSSIQSIFNTEGTYSLNNDNNTPFPGTNNDDDSTYYLDFPPDGMPYMPDEAALVGEDTATGGETCAEIWAEIDALKADIYASGDPELIEYLDSVLLPSAYFPECDSQQNANYRIAQNNSDASGFNVYPNPNNGNFTIAFDNKGDYSIAVYNALGIIVYTEQVYERTLENLQLNGLSPGIYTIVVGRSGTPQVQRKKMTVVY